MHLDFGLAQCAKKAVIQDIEHMSNKGKTSQIVHNAIANFQSFPLSGAKEISLCSKYYEMVGRCSLNRFNICSKWFLTIDGQQSSHLPINYGVSQGSVLGPILFLLYVNDIPQHLSHLSIDILADDTTICKYSLECYFLVSSRYKL